MDCFPTPFASARWLCLAAVLIIAGPAGAQSLPPGLVTGAPTTQHLTFAAGPNQVSLSVFPADRSIEAIFGAQLPHVLLVKDDAGAVHSTQYGVHTLTEWPWDASVSVYAREPFSLDVSGPRIEPWSQIPLAAGWSWVPSLVAAPTPVGDALASLAASLSRVEDGAGRAYPAAPGEAALTTLEPGAGYRLRLAAPATLAYTAVPPTSPPPPTAPPGGPPQTEVPTVLDAIALTGLVPGQEVAVRGFRADGDGGAGRLRVTTSGCAPDGGTCFVPTEHTAAGEPYSSDWGFTLYGEDLQWESFRLCHSQASAPQNATQVTGDGCFDALQLHGHGAGGGGDKLFDPATGRVEITSPMKTFARLYDGTDRFTATFRYATDDVRLERIVDVPLTLEGTSTTTYVRPEWWGGQPGAGDATDAVAWAWEAAEAKAADREYYVVLSGMYGYAGVLETQDGTVLKGAQDGVRDGQGLRVLRGAPWHFWAVKPSTAAALREPFTERDATAQNMDPIVVVRHGRRSLSDRVVDIEIDGNLAENGYVFEFGYRYSTGLSSYSGGSYLDEMLQNTPHWNGFVASHQHNDNVAGSRTRLENLHIHDVGGNLWLSNEPVDFGGSHDVRLGNSARNHVIYGVGMRPESSIDRVEIYGFFWKGAHEVKQGTWRDVTFRDLVQPPALYTRDRLEVLVSHRNDDTDPGEFGTPSASGYYFGDDVAFERLTFDMGQAYPTHGAIYYAQGPMSIQGVTVRQADPSKRLFLLNSRGYSGSRSSFSLENVTVESGGLGGIVSAGARQSRIRRIALPPGPPTAGPAELYIASPTSPDEVYTFYGVTGTMSSSEPVALQARTAGAGARLFVQDASFTGIQNHFMFVGDDPSDPDVQRRYQAYFRRVGFSSFEPINNNNGQNTENWRVSYYEAVTVGSRRSEDSGVLSAAGVTSGSVDVPVNLFHVPFDPSYVTMTGTDAGRFIGWTNVGTAEAPVLRLAFSGSAPVSVQWSAAVRPIPAGVTFPD